MTLATKVTWDFNEGDMATTIEVAPGACGGGWGITRIELTTRTPVRPDFLPAFFMAASRMVLSGGVPELVALHDAEDADGC